MEKVSSGLQDKITKLVESIVDGQLSKATSAVASLVAKFDQAVSVANTFSVNHEVQRAPLGKPGPLLRAGDHGFRHFDRPATPTPRSGPSSPGVAGEASIGTGGKRRILIALAQYPEGMDSRRLALLSGISQKGGTWRTYLGELRGAGWVVGSGKHLQITAEGIAALGSFEPLPTGEALIEYWRNRLGDGGKRRIFDRVVEAHPHGVSAGQVASDTGIEMSGGTWRTYLGELRRPGADRRLRGAAGRRRTVCVIRQRDYRAHFPSGHC